MMKKCFVIGPSGTNREGSTTKAIFEVTLYLTLLHNLSNKLLWEDRGSREVLTVAFKVALYHHFGPVHHVFPPWKGQVHLGFY